MLFVTWGDPGSNLLFHQFEQKSITYLSSYKTEHFPNENWVISCLIQKKRMTVRIGVCQLILLLALTRYLIPALFMISPLSAPIQQTTRALRWKGASKLWVSVMKCQLRVGGRSHKSYRSSLISPGLCSLDVRSHAEECRAKKQVRKSHSEPSFPKCQHSIDVPQKVPHLVHQNLHLLVLLTHFLYNNKTFGH